LRFAEGFLAQADPGAQDTKYNGIYRRAWRVLTEKDGMATRDRRLAEFNGEGEPPPDQPVQVLCEDHSGTYQLPFPCRFIDGAWRNHESGGTVEATVVGWRMRRP
jgi:hypothetical protein